MCDREFITAMHLSTLSPHLLIGTHDSSIHILALPSLQSIRTISIGSGQSIPLPNPITFLSTMARPVDLVGKSSVQKMESLFPRQIGQLKRNVESREERLEGVAWVRMQRNEDVRCCPLSFCDLANEKTDDESDRSSIEDQATCRNDYNHSKSTSNEWQHSDTSDRI